MSTKEHEIAGMRLSSRNVRGHLAPSGRDVPELTAHLDVLPTLMDLCGLECPNGLRSDGVSLRALLEGNADKWPDRTIVESFTKVAMTDRWRLVHSTALYDVLADPGQRHDVARQHPDVVARLQAALAENERGEDTRQRRILLGAEKAMRVTLTPEQLKTPIRAAITGGRALKITQAGVRLGSCRETAAVDEKMDSVSFTTELPAGAVDLRAWFITESKQRLGAYFVDVERLASLEK